MKTAPQPVETEDHGVKAFFCVLHPRSSRRRGRARRKMIARKWQDNVAGRVSNERFDMLSRSYEDEQRGLKTDVETLRQEIDEQEQQIQNLTQFIEKVKSYTELKELTAYAVHDLIKAIYIGAPDKSSGQRRQDIHIVYDLIGFIPLGELMEEEMA